MAHLIAHSFLSPRPPLAYMVFWHRDRRRFSFTITIPSLNSSPAPWLAQLPMVSFQHVNGAHAPSLAPPPMVSIHHCYSMPAWCSITITCLATHGFHSPPALFASTVPPHHLLSDRPWFPFTTGAPGLNDALALYALPAMIFHHYCSVLTSCARTLYVKLCTTKLCLSIMPICLRIIRRFQIEINVFVYKIALPWVM